MIDGRRFAAAFGIALLVGAVVVAATAPASMSNTGAQTGAVEAQPATVSTGSTVAAQTMDWVIKPVNAYTIECQYPSHVLGVYLTGDATECADDQSTVDTGGATAEEVQSNIYSSAGTIKQGSDTIYQSQQVLNDKGDAYVWGQAKTEIVEAHEDQLSEAEAKERARKVVNEEYSRMQKAILDRRTTVSNELVSLRDSINNTANLTHDDVFSYAPTDQSTQATEEYLHTTNKSYTLVNGDSYNWSDYSVSSFDNELYSVSGDVDQIYIKSVDTELSNQEIANRTPSANLLSEIESQASTTRSDLETFASDFYANYNPGTVNASEFLSPQQIAQEYGLNSSDGAARSQVSAALLGYKTNATQTVTIEFTATGTTKTGGLFAENDPPTTAPNSSTPAWLTGEKYVPSPDYENASNYINGSAYLADNDGRWIELQNNFTILSQTDATTGESINVSTSKTYTELTTDASNLSRQLANLNAALDNRTDLEDNSCGLLCFGGSGGDGGGPPIALIAVLVLLSLGAVGVVAYVAYDN